MSTVKLSDDFYRVPKLSNVDLSNWIEYRDRLQWALDARGILSHLDGTAVAPSEPIATTPSLNILCT
jgi:hypothetical protein